jgi:hypothetical protein
VGKALGHESAAAHWPVGVGVRDVNTHPLLAVVAGEEFHRSLLSRFLHWNKDPEAHSTKALIKQPITVVMVRIT